MALSMNKEAFPITEKRPIVENRIPNLIYFPVDNNQLFSKPLTF